MTQTVARPAIAAPVAAAPALPVGRVPAAPLRAALTHMAAVAPRRSSNPLLPNVLLRSEGGLLTLSATNLELDWHERLTACDLPPFAVAVNAARLAKIAALFGKGDVPLGATDRVPYGLEIYAEQAAMLFTLEGTNPDDMPLRPYDPPAGAASGSVPAPELSEAIRRVKYAASDVNFQAVFRGICLGGRPGFNEVAASDGYRVAVYTLSASLPYTVIPAPTANLLASAFASLDSDTPASLTVTQAGREADNSGPYPAECVRVDAGHITVLARCMDGQFPDYGRVLVSDGATAEWNRTPLLKRLHGLSIASDYSANNRVELRQTGSLLTLESEADGIQAQSTLDLDTPLGGEKKGSISASYNLRHLRDAAYNAPDETLRVTIQNQKEGVRTLQVQAGNYRAVAVSLRV